MGCCPDAEPLTVAEEGAGLPVEAVDPPNRSDAGGKESITDAVVPAVGFFGGVLEEGSGVVNSSKKSRTF
jgi:hypothetical protein